MKTEFKVGDRVAFYSGRARRIGEVESIRDAFELFVRCSKGGDRKFAYSVHSKQCRKLVKKPRRRLWVLNEALNARSEGTVYNGLVYTCDPKNKEYSEFIEVRKKSS